MSSDTPNLYQLEVYNSARQLGNTVWDIVHNWTYFERKTIGIQVVRAVDSISANIAEGYGRYHYKDKLRFYYFARGSLYESTDWITKAIHRELITEPQSTELVKEIQSLNKRLNGYIRAIRDAGRRRD